MELHKKIELDIVNRYKDSLLRIEELNSSQIDDLLMTLEYEVNCENLKYYPLILNWMILLEKRKIQLDVKKKNLAI